MNELKQICIDFYKVNFDNYYENIPKLEKEKQISLSFQYKRTSSVEKLAEKIFKWYKINGSNKKILID